MRRRLGRRPLLIVTAAAVAAALFAPIEPVQANDWPNKPITIVVGFNPGGSVDRMARGLATFLTHEVKVPVTVVNKPGAGGMLGHTYFLQQPDEGYTLLVSPATPYIANNILVTGAKFKMEDFAFVNAQWTDWTFIATAKNKPYKTLGDLIESIKSNPGRISTGVTYSSAGHLSTLALLDALSLPPDAVRIVTFDGGGPVRTALAGGQIDFSVVQAEGSEVIREEARPLAVFLAERNPDWDAPPVNEALAPYQTKVPLISGSVRVLAAQARFREKHPDRWEKLVAAYKRTLERSDYQEWLKQNQMGGDWLGPEKSTALLMENYQVLVKYKDLLKK